MYEDLAQRAEDLAHSLRVYGKTPLNDITASLLEENLDRLLDEIQTTNAKGSLQPGTVLDVEPASPHDTVRISALDALERLDDSGFFAQFNEPARSRVMATLSSLEGVCFDVERLRHSKELVPSGLVDIIAWATQVAVTGNADASSWIEVKDSPWLHPVD